MITTLQTRKDIIIYFGIDPRSLKRIKLKALLSQATLCQPAWLQWNSQWVDVVFNDAVQLFTKHIPLKKP